LIVLSVGVHLLDSVDSLREAEGSPAQRCNISREDNSSLYMLFPFPPSEVELKYIFTKPKMSLEKLDMFLTTIFTFEFVARFLACPRKCRFMRGFLNLLDLLFLVCKLPLVYMELCGCFASSNAIWAFVIFKTVTSVRLVRLFRIGGSCQGFRVMVLSIKASKSELVLMVGSISCLMTMFAVVVYMAEMHIGTFTDTFQACWWAIITMTTVGYGDLYPHGAVGRIVGTVCALTGLVVITLPIAVIGTKFAEYYSVNQDRSAYVEEKKKECPVKRAKRLISNKIENTNVTKF